MMEQAAKAAFFIPFAKDIVAHCKTNLARRGVKRGTRPISQGRKKGE